MIKALNLDKEFRPTSHEPYLHKLLTFNGGESHIKILNPKVYETVNTAIITHRIQNGDNIMQILIAADAIRRNGTKDIELIIPYLPYARQDRLCDIGESFTLKIFCDLINSANFSKVTILDAHSDVGPALLNNCVNISNKEYVQRAAHDIQKMCDMDIILVSPDSGANKKVNQLFYGLPGLFTDVIKCDKKRDMTTGELSGFKVFCDDLNGQTCLIVDDICDGGRTFIGIAEALKAKGAGDIFLFVTHGIFSNGFEELNKHFMHIYTTQSFKTFPRDSVTQISIEL